MAHEALMEGWQRFTQWRKENRELRRLIDRVEDAFQEWMKNQQDENLMMGGLLSQVRKQWQELEPNLLPSVAAFYQLSIEVHNRQIEEITSSQRIKDDFLAVVSHELRTPLISILGWISLLRNRKLGEATTAHAFETIDRNAKHQALLIDNLIHISNLKARRLKLKQQEFNLTHLVNRTIESVRPKVEAKNLALNVCVNLHNSRIINDHVHLQQILFNLLSNAIKFTHLGIVSVEIYEFSLDEIVIMVKDTGIGIPETELQNVFEQFQQVDMTTYRRYGGLGLGLAITSHLVRMMQGTITVESKLGEGSAFRVQLPRRVSPGM